MTQCQRIIKFLEMYGSITTMQAFRMGITRLASRIHELRKMGYEIRVTTLYGVNEYGKYHCALYTMVVK